MRKVFPFRNIFMQIGWVGWLHKRQCETMRQLIKHCTTTDNIIINMTLISKHFVCLTCMPRTLQWRHNERDGVSYHRRLVYLLNRLFRRRSKKTSKLHVTGLCEGNHRWPVDSPHKGPVTRKILPFDDVIMWARTTNAHCIDVTWTSWHLKSQATDCFFFNNLFRITRKQTPTLALHYWILVISAGFTEQNVHFNYMITIRITALTSLPVSIDQYICIYMPR